MYNLFYLYFHSKHLITSSSLSSYLQVRVHCTLYHLFAPILVYLTCTCFIPGVNLSLHKLYTPTLHPLLVGLITTISLVHVDTCRNVHEDDIQCLC